MTDEETTAFLAHHGVKGMHWGQRKSTDTPSQPSRSEKKAAKTQTKEAYQKSQDRLILNSRKSVEKAGDRVDKAKLEYKAAKHTEGRAKAKEILKQSKAEFKRHYNNSVLETGKERSDRILQEIGEMHYKAGQGLGDAVGTSISNSVNRKLSSNRQY